MTLDNLLKIGQLKRHTTDQKEIGNLLVAARRNLADAHAANISTENRFDAAYKCIMQCALVGLMANGFRPDTKVPGHHQTVIQSLPRKFWFARGTCVSAGYVAKQAQPFRLHGQGHRFGFARNMHRRSGTFVGRGWRLVDGKPSGTYAIN